MIDLSKAFDTLNMSILLKKLEFYEVSGVPLRWFESNFLVRERLACMKYRFDNIGVVQGSEVR